MLISINAGLNLNAQLKYYLFYYAYWTVRDTVIELGMICACILAIYQISNGAPIGNFVMLVSYWANFTGDSLTLIAVGAPRWLTISSETYQLRRCSTQIDPGSHRYRGDA